MSPSRRLDDALARLEAAEQQFLASDFLAPMPRGGRVQVRIAGVVCTLKVTPADFEGWGIFRPLSHTHAQLTRPATLAERQSYLALFPSVKVILCRREGRRWLAVPAHANDRRLRLAGPVAVHLVEEPQLFEAVTARCDGAQCWYEGPDLHHDPGIAAFLRQALGEMIMPDQLERAGLTAGDRAAYAVAYEATLEAERDRIEVRLRQALGHANARLIGYVERDDCYRVEYEVDGRRQVSVLAHDDLAVQVAGICLSGQDARFDLQSLVGVVREAQGTGVVRVGRDNEGMDEDMYWRVHPPESEPPNDS